MSILRRLDIGDMYARPIFDRPGHPLPFIIPSYPILYSPLSIVIYTANLIGLSYIKYPLLVYPFYRGVL